MIPELDGGVRGITSSRSFSVYRKFRGSLDYLVFKQIKPSQTNNPSPQKQKPQMFSSYILLVIRSTVSLKILKRWVFFFGACICGGCAATVSTCVEVIGQLWGSVLSYQEGPRWTAQIVRFGGKCPDLLRFGECLRPYFGIFSCFHGSERAES